MHTPPTAARERLHMLLPCAGSGSRAGAGLPKQYRPLLGQALLLHTLKAVQPAAPWATLALLVPAGDEMAAVALQDGAVQGVSLWPCGGPTRAETVRNGLQTLLQCGADPQDWVLVHDAARCLVTPDLIQRLLLACSDDSVGGLLALPVPDTLKRGHEGRVAGTVDRRDHWLAQTPQMFRLGVLARALDTALRATLADPAHTVTDEASAVEALGLAPLLVPGRADNFKVTYPEDFAMAEHLLKGRAA